MCVGGGTENGTDFCTCQKGGVPGCFGVVMERYRSSSEREIMDLYTILSVLSAGASLVSNVLAIATQVLPFF